VKVLPPDAAGFQAAAALLRAGEVVAYPTETVYGLAVDPLNPDAVRRLFQAKGRPETNPVLLLVSGDEQLHRVVAEISQEARLLMQAFWPGPLSLLLPRHPDIGDAVTAASSKVCVRHAAHPIAAGLCQVFGAAITSTSANRSGEAPARSVDELAKLDIAAVLDGGPLPPSAPSTIYDPETRAVLRAGAISEAAITKALHGVNEPRA